jgi:branched-subunit amino acid ABC-type transport system permease component
MTHASQFRPWSSLTRHRFFLLFVFLLATLILFPYAEASHFGSYAFRVIGSFAILVSVYAANLHRSLLILAIALAIPALLERIVLPKVNSHSFYIFNILLTLVFDVVIVVVIFPPCARRGTANIGKHLWSALPLSAGGLQFCQRLRISSRLPAKRFLSGSAY